MADSSYEPGLFFWGSVLGCLVFRVFWFGVALLLGS